MATMLTESPKIAHDPDNAETHTLISAIEPPAKGNRITYDSKVKGFGVRVTAAGGRSYVLNYRTDRGRERRYTIGDFGDLKLAGAREEAKSLKQRVSKGEDPMAERHARREAETVADLAAIYQADYLPGKSPKSQEEDAAMIRQHILPTLGKLPVTEVRRHDVRKLHKQISETTPIRANRTLAVLSKMFSLAVEEELRGDNPCTRVKRNPEERRERFLSQTEIARLFDALGEYPNQTTANAIRLLVLTGARRGEVLNAKWSQFDKKPGHWVKPSAYTKQRKEHRVPLNAPARQLLASIREQKLGEEWVFPGRDRSAPLNNVGKCWRFAVKRADLKGVRLHDLRHTFASILVSGGASLPLVGRMLGHTQPTTTARYAHLYDDPLQEAAERVGEFVTAAENGHAGHVVALKK